MSCSPTGILPQPINSRLPGYGDYSDDEARKRDTAAWSDVLATLQETLRRAANSAFRNKRLSAERKHDYFKSGEARGAFLFDQQ